MVDKAPKKSPKKMEPPFVQEQIIVFTIEYSVSPQDVAGIGEVIDKMCETGSGDIVDVRIETRQVFA